MRRVISLFLPHWPTDRWRRIAQPGITQPGITQPGIAPPGTAEAPPERTLLTATRDGRNRLVAATDARAAAAGLYVGMAVSQAQAMHPDLTILPAEPEADAHALRRLAAWCLRASPLAAACPPDGVWIDITGCAHLAGGEAPLLAGLLARLAAAGITATGAIADTPGCAHAVARFAAGPHATPPASIIPPGQTEAAIAPLPLAALRLPDETVAALRRLGFDHIAQLLRTPRAPLARRLGPLPLRRLDQALGRLPEPIEPVLPPELPRARLGFAEPIATADDLARAAAQLTATLCGRLERQGLGALRLDLVSRRSDGSDAWVRVGTNAASRDPAHLRRLLAERIDSIDPGFGIEAMTLCASRTTPLGADQATTLLRPQHTADLARLVDTLSNRLGEGRVYRLGAVQSDLPERAVTRLPPLAGATPAAAWPDPHFRPTRLFDPPLPIEAIALLPDQPPRQFVWRRRAHRIRHACGPERLFGEWWRDAGETWAVRDYFRVEDEDGQRFWLFRQGDGQDPATGDLGWFLHGVFS